jgi:hypothetical protein
MAFRPNYNQQRSDRNRAKAQKKQEKLQRREEESAKRTAVREGREHSEKALDNEKGLHRHGPHEA